MGVEREAEKQLFLAYRRSRDPRARELLVERYLPLARSLARRYRRSAEPLEDLEQVACLALVKAVDGFDPTRDTAFSSYAVPSIAGAIKRHFRDYGWSLHMPRDVQELALRIERISDGLSGPTGAAPTAAEIARHAGVSLEEVLDAREAHHALYAVSLEAQRGSEGDDSEPLLHTLAAEDREIPRAEDRVMLDSLLRTLDPRSERIVRLYYQHDLTQEEIGRQLGISQMHISRLLRQAVGQLARAAEPEKREANRQRDWMPVAARTASPLPPSIRYVSERGGRARR